MTCWMLHVFWESYGGNRNETRSGTVGHNTWLIPEGNVLPCLFLSDFSGRPYSLDYSFWLPKDSKLACLDSSSSFTSITMASAKGGSESRFPDLSVTSSSSRLIDTPTLHALMDWTAL